MVILTTGSTMRKDIETSTPTMTMEDVPGIATTTIIPTATIKGRQGGTISPQLTVV